MLEIKMVCGTRRANTAKRLITETGFARDYKDLIRSSLLTLDDEEKTNKQINK